MFKVCSEPCPESKDVTWEGDSGMAIDVAIASTKGTVFACTAIAATCLKTGTRTGDEPVESSWGLFSEPPALNCCRYL